jgi:hypothetical protein
MFSTELPIRYARPLHLLACAPAREHVDFVSSSFCRETLDNLSA